jgi:hypothetical protein
MADETALPVFFSLLVTFSFPEWKNFFVGILGAQKNKPHGRVHAAA